MAGTCAACGTENPPENRFCGSCGTPLLGTTSGGSGAGLAATPGAGARAAVAERRLVSVLFADLVGFTTLSEHRDPEEVRDLLSQYFDRCRKLIERYGGTVEKFIGDAVMAIWGSPVAREDDAERAVRAALALTQMVGALGEEVGLPDLRLRGGVLTGNAAVELGAEGEGMVLGDTVNTASRLQSIATPGTVLVDDVTRRSSEAAIDYEDAGAHQVKGREQPVHAWQALRVLAGVGGARRGTALEAPLVGRERELQTIIDVAEDTVTHRTARLVTVTGEAGTGKSRLLWEFFKYIDGIEQVRWWHQGRCLSYGEGVSYWALAEMVRTRAGITEEDDAQSERVKLAAVIERFVSHERERRLVHPRLAQLLGLEQRAAGEAADLFSGWRLFFERMAEAQPVVLAFEDLQWADSGLLDFIDYLLEWSADYPIFILALGRPELEERRPNWGTAIRLTGLSDDSMQHLLEGLVPGLAPDLTSRILERAEGVPLYAVETVRMLLDRGLLAQEGNRYMVTGAIEDLEVPETLQALAAARLDNLAPGERTLLQDAAVLGTSFSPAALADVSQRRQTDVRQTLEALVSKQVLGREDDPRSSQQGQYFFLQALLRTISLGMLSRRERKARHLAAAQHFESSWGEEAAEIAEVLASHYLGAIAADPDAADVPEIRSRACQTLITAGRRATSLALGTEARALFERAAELAEDDAERASLLSEAGTAAARSDREEGAGLLREAITLLDAAGQDEAAAVTRMRLAQALIGLNRLEEADRVMNAAAALTDPALLAEAAALRGRIAFLRADFSQTREQSELALSIADPMRLDMVIADAAMNKAIALMYENRLNEGGTMFALALDVAVRADLPEAALRAFYNLADFRTLQGQLPEASELIERGLELARERGNRAWERDLLSQRVQVDFARGEWDRVLSTAQSLDVPGGEDSYRVAATALPLVFAARGQLEALGKFTEPTRPRSEWAELALMEALGEAVALSAIAQPEAAADRLESVSKLFVEVSSGTMAHLPLDAAEIFLRAGRRDLAGRLADRTGVPPPMLGPQLRQVRAMLDANAGELASAEQDLRQALDELRPIDAPFMLARCLHNLAAVLTRTDRAHEAIELLREAEALFRRLGAAAWLERNAALIPQEAVA
jgi:class 3 adenylate cyclase/tetratricopeptide (TPR) repeat protein